MSDKVKLKKGAKPKLSNKMAIGAIGQMPDVNEPWVNAFLGGVIPSVKVPYPPKIYSQEYNSRDYYELAHGQYFLGFWADGRITLCQYDKGDFCCTAEGKVYGGSNGYCGPTWVMPLEICEQGLGSGGLGN
jgi:hypothetical protein